MIAAERWRSRAACRGTNPALFYDLHPDAIDAAKAVCARCPVRTQCRAQAVAAGEEFGVWGGLAADERPTPPLTGPRGRGPAPRIGDDELYDLFANADPERPALDQLLEHIWLPTATAYTTLDRAVRLGVVERRGRGLFPLRR
jgi:WhiB family redox-sensing transcriptional regulator